MNKFNCFKLVFSSSALIYRPVKVEIYMNNFQEPINPYGNTKLTIEKILNDLFKSDENKWKIINLRYFNLWVHMNLAN